MKTKKQTVLVFHNFEAYFTKNKINVMLFFVTSL